MCRKKSGVRASEQAIDSINAKRSVLLDSKHLMVFTSRFREYCICCVLSRPHSIETIYAGARERVRKKNRLFFLSSLARTNKCGRRKKVHRRIMIIISECSLLINCVHNNSRLSCIYNIYSIYKHEITSAHWPKQFCVAAAHTRCIEYNITKLSSVFALDAKKIDRAREFFSSVALWVCVLFHLFGFEILHFSEL